MHIVGTFVKIQIIIVRSNEWRKQEYKQIVNVFTALVRPSLLFFQKMKFKKEGGRKKLGYHMFSSIFAQSTSYTVRRLEAIIIMHACLMFFFYFFTHICQHSQKIFLSFFLESVDIRPISSIGTTIQLNRATIEMGI